MLLAEINVAANVTTIVTANIVDKHKGMWTEAWITLTLINGWTGTLKALKSINGFVTVYADLVTGASAYTTALATFPTGYRPPIVVGAFLRDESNSGTLVVQVGVTPGGPLLLYAGAVTGRVVKGAFVFYAG
jgi:hypothetical protein